MFRVGLTGGIGSGKSTASGLFAQQGVPVIDADAIAREVVAPGQPALEAIRQAFGAAAIGADGTLDRAWLRTRVFAAPDERQRLEELLHPLIRDAIRDRVRRLTAPYVIIAIPLLVEKGWRSEVDRVLVIDAPVEQQIARTASRDQMQTEDVMRILAAQGSREERLAAADDVLCNEGDLNALRERVTLLHQRYLRLAGQR
ncbi:MAG: dephospho-CoA kinase [Gammaproteobacteria bacterium]|nr:dephospho-CoA kinase [Gammaproteobacteria bacterium]